MSGTQFGMNSSSAYGAMGYIAGISKTVNTTAYISSALSYTHSILSDYFDRWVDATARAEPRSFQHVYEWPTTFHNYNETVGVPAFRLWKNTLSGHGRNKEASFKFLASRRPTPVDPILLQPGPSGETVKEHVHIFVLKAQVMEYGLDVEVTPKLAKYLAYVGRTGAHGRDAGWHHSIENPDGSSINFSDGPVTFTAGGDVTKGKFTEAFITWWSTLASGTFDQKIAPGLEADLVDRAKLDAAIRLGNMAAKHFSIGAAPAHNARTYADAEAMAIAKLADNQAKYINQAAARRRIIYGY